MYIFAAEYECACTCEVHPPAPWASWPGWTTETPHKERNYLIAEQRWIPFARQGLAPAGKFGSLPCMKVQKHIHAPEIASRAPDVGSSDNEYPAVLTRWKVKNYGSGDCFIAQHLPFPRQAGLSKAAGEQPLCGAMDTCSVQRRGAWAHLSVLCTGAGDGRGLHHEILLTQEISMVVGMYAHRLEKLKPITVPNCSATCSLLNSVEHTRVAKVKDNVTITAGSQVDDGRRYDQLTGDAALDVLSTVLHQFACLSGMDASTDSLTHSPFAALALCLPSATCLTHYHQQCRTLSERNDLCHRRATSRATWRRIQGTMHVPEWRLQDQDRPCSRSMSTERRGIGRYEARGLRRDLRPPAATAANAPQAGATARIPVVLLPVCMWVPGQDVHYEDKVELTSQSVDARHELKLDLDMIKDCVLFLALKSKAGLIFLSAIKDEIELSQNSRKDRRLWVGR
ncbi:hypothetical protein B0H10DRAFT_1940412 [Mycena sp. CBHHK59/15]|nr:hypothetical protein B0H10DRAFT_1940412 [Mycena sp. CBHHK59/15]